MDAPPTWALSLAYGLHMLATVAWLGSLAALAVLVLPAARRALDIGTYATLLGAIQRRLDPLGWFCLAVLAGTGMFQMSASPQYQGFLAVRSTWAAAILAKHLVILGMVAISGYLTWGVLPGLRRAALRQARGQEVSREALLRREALLLSINFALGIVVLALTAIARAS